MARRGKICTRKLLLSPTFTMIKYRGMPTAAGTNISAAWFNLNSHSLARNFFLEKAYADIAVIKMEEATVSNVIMIVLIRNRDIGMPVLEVRFIIMRKFCMVGRRTIKVGGKRKSSSRGLKAWFKIYTIGSVIKRAIGIITR
jgi:hypothetical protein